MPSDEYIRNQKYFNVEIGDIVTIFRKPTSDDEWDVWVPEMDDAIGKSGKVIGICDNGILVEIPGIIGPVSQAYSWYYPYTCMRIVR